MHLHVSIISLTNKIHACTCIYLRPKQEGQSICPKKDFSKRDVMTKYISHYKSASDRMVNIVVHYM